MEKGYFIFNLISCTAHNRSIHLHAKDQTKDQWFFKAKTKKQPQISFSCTKQQPPKPFSTKSCRLQLTSIKQHYNVLSWLMNNERPSDFKSFSIVQPIVFLVYLYLYPPYQSFYTCPNYLSWDSTIFSTIGAISTFSIMLMNEILAFEFSYDLRNTGHKFIQVHSNSLYSSIPTKNRMLLAQTCVI